MIGAGILATPLLILFLILISAFFSAAETGLTAISRARIYKLEKEGNRRAKMVHKLRDNKELLIGTVLLGNNLMNIAASAIATSVFIDIWGEHALVYVTLIMTALVLIFGEVMPKTYAINNPERTALFVAPVFMWLIKILSPVTYAVQWINDAVWRLFGKSGQSHSALVSASDALRGTIELQHRDGEIVKMEKDMLGGILDLAETGVGEVMVHRKNMVTIDIDLPIREIIQTVIDSEHSRLPFWQEEQDNIIGILHSRNLMRLLNEFAIDNITQEMIVALLSKPWYIPDSTTLRIQLIEFRRLRHHFALVVDEYGALMGMVTLEDILEEIVGEIEDEHDEPDSGEIKSDGSDGYIMDGTLTIRDLNRHLDWDLPDENATTMAGLLLHELRIIPDAGQQFTLYKRRFTVLEKSGNQITRIHVQPLASEPEDSDDQE